MSNTCKDCKIPIHGNGEFCKNCLNLPKNCTRYCPKCREAIIYKSRNNMLTADKKRLPCKKCDYLERKTKYLGKNNPFYGKKHTEEFKNKLSQERQGWFAGIKNPKKGNSGENNPMYGVSFYEKWIEKYDKDIADRKLIEFKNKQSKLSKGKNNSMYAKVPGIGSGNGISGWYKGWYFRSLNELSYMIYIIERFNFSWQSAEKKEYAIKYIDENKQERNYFPDFIINDKYIIEIKPKELRNTVRNQLKFKGAENYFQNLEFKVVSSPRIIKKEELKKLMEENKVKLLDKWKTKLNL